MGWLQFACAPNTRRVAPCTCLIHLLARPPGPPLCPAECRFAEAVRCLEQCSPATLQPSQLFPLFPAYTSRWAQQASGFAALRQLGARCSRPPCCLPTDCVCCCNRAPCSAPVVAQVPTHQQYWGLHAPLPSLEALIDRRLSHGQRQAESSSSGAHCPSPSRGARSSGAAGGARGGSSSPGSGSLFALEGEGGSSEGGASPASSRSNQPPASKGQHPGNQQEGSGQPPASLEALAQQAQREQRQETQPGGAERRRLQRQAWEALAQYLFRVRRGIERVASLSERAAS